MLFIPSGRALLLCALLSVSGHFLFAQEARMEDGQRELAADMLQDVHKDVKNDYYDPRFHGVDIDARFRQAAELIKKASSFNQAMGAVAWYLEPLNDSHTFFVPPSRAFHLDYGWRMQMVGDKCLITAVKPGTDAETQGLNPGDQVLTIATIPPDRNNLWKLEYLFNTLRPQPAIHLTVQRPSGEQRTLDVQAEIIRSQQLITGDNFWKEIVDRQRESRQYDRRSYSIEKDTLIWKLPSYVMNEKGVDAVVGEAAGYKTLIMDLRANPGGYVRSLERMVGDVFDRDITIQTEEERKKTEKMIGHGNNRFSGKLIVLIDSQSASAAEIFARVIQLEKRGIVIGDQSAGAVMISEGRPHRIGFGSEEKVSFGSASTVYFGDSLTIANVVMSDGKSLEHVGVTPDEVLLPTPQDLAAGRDPVLARAIALAGGQMSPEEAGKLFPVKWIKYN